MAGDAARLPTLPHRLSYFRLWRDDGTWQRIHDELRDETRQATGRNPSPSAVVMDAQSVKTVEKRGLLGDRRRQADQGAQAVSRCQHAWLDPGGRRHRRIYADAGYRSQPLTDWLWETGRWVLEIVRGVSSPADARSRRSVGSWSGRLAGSIAIAA